MPKLLDDADDSAANAAAVAEIQREAAGDPEAPEVVDLAEDETPEERETRLDKKAGRWKRHTQETEEARQRADALAEQNRILQESISRQTSIAERMAAHLERQMPKEKSSLELQQEQAEKDRDSLQQSWGLLSETQKGERLDEFRKRANDIDQTLRVLAAKQVEATRPSVNVAEQAQAAATEATIASTHGDVWYNPAAKARSQVVYQNLLKSGKPSNWITLSEAMDQTRDELGMPSAKRTQREATRRKFTGISRGGGGADADQGGTMGEITSGEKRLAHQMYPKLDLKESEAKWMREVKYAK